jgi:hydrogenase maturation protease
MASILVLGLGNELLADDGVGILAARALAAEVGEHADVVETSQHGLALLDSFLGYRRAIIIDAIHTTTHAPGTILELNPEDLPPVATPSPHYTGLPEMLLMAGQLQLDFPRQIKIFALEIVDPHTVGGAITPPVQAALPALIQRVRHQLDAWTNDSHA